MAPFRLRPQTFERVKAAVALRGARKRVTVLQVKAKNTYRVEVTADLHDSTTSRWRSKGIKYPRGKMTRDWAAE